MMKQLTVGIIGLGVMGRAIHDQLSSIKALTVIGFDRNNPGNQPETLQTLVQESQVLLLAVKPQQFAELASELKPLVTDQLIVSIMAGVSVASMQQALGQRRVVRAMPNLAARVGESVTGWYADRSLSSDECRLMQVIFSSFGSELQLEEEIAIDALTAISGSGPGYFFYLAQAMTEAAQSLGFSPAVADELVRQTLVGAGQFAAVSDQSFDQLTKAVASKGGTTEAALAGFDRSGVASSIAEAITAAHQRAQALAKDRA